MELSVLLVVVRVHFGRQVQRGAPLDTLPHRSCSHHEKTCAIVCVELNLHTRNSKTDTSIQVAVHMARCNTSAELAGDPRVMVGKLGKSRCCTTSSSRSRIELHFHFYIHFHIHHLKCHRFSHYWCLPEPDCYICPREPDIRTSTRSP